MVHPDNAARGFARAEVLAGDGLRIASAAGGADRADWRLPDQVAQIEIMARAAAGEMDENRRPSGDVGAGAARPRRPH